MEAITDQDWNYLLIYWIVGMIIALISTVREEKLTAFHLWFIPVIGILTLPLILFYSISVVVDGVVEFIIKMFKPKNK